MPSTKATRQTSPVTGGSGQTCQNSAVLLLKVLPAPGMSACLFLDSSQPRNSSSLLAELSTRPVALAPQDLHLHLVFPALVFPLRFIASPHEGHLTTFIPSSLPPTNFQARNSMV